MFVPPNMMIPIGLKRILPAREMEWKQSQVQHAECGPLLGVSGKQYDVDLWNFPFEAEGESTLSTEQARWSRSTAKPHTLWVSQMEWLQTICGPVCCRELRWSCGTLGACAKLCLCVLHIVFHYGCRALHLHTHWKQLKLKYIIFCGLML